MKQQLTTLLFLIPFISFSQGFTNGNSSYGISMVNTGAISHGAGVTFYDFNQDGLDDITFCSASDSLVFYESTGTGFIRKEIIPNNLDMRQASWCDFDKDGDPDLLVTKARNTGNNTKLYRNDGYPVFVDITDNLNLPNLSGVRSYGHTWGDYDKDGWIDLYICNYNITGGITNWLFHNNGDGTFTEMSMLAGVSNGSNLTFQATFCDFNEDTWPDLFLINDLNQTSTMYMNNGDGTFTDVGADNGAHLMIEAMSITIDDFQNDNDWDIYVTNIANGNIFLVNDNGIYTDQASDANLTVNRMTWGSTWIDFDNDGDQDIHMVTTQGSNNQNPFFVNNGDNTFTETNELGFLGDVTNAYSNARGDFNNDGFYDLIQSTVGSQNSYIFWENNGVGGNYVKVDLHGTYSNTDAIGSVVEYWIDGNKKRYGTFIGEGFLSQNAHTKIIGIGEASAIDSLSIHWPMGLVETYYDLQAGERYDYIEGTTLTNSIVSENNGVLCSTLMLSAGDWSTYSWSTGSEESTITIEQAGTYSVTVTNEFGYPVYAEIEVMQGYFNDFVSEVQQVDCFGNNNGAINLTELNDAVYSIVWLNQVEEFSPVNLAPGTYEMEATSEDGCVSTLSFEITEPEILQATANTSNVICFGELNGTATLETTGGTGEVIWNTENLDLNALAAGDYTINGTDENACLVSVDFTIEEPSELEVTAVITDAFFGDNGNINLTVTGGTEPYEYLWSNGDEDNVANDIGQGTYTCAITDANGCTIDYTGNIIDLNVSEFEAATFEIYPNPARSTISISRSNINIPSDLSLFNALGQLMISEKNVGQQTELNLENLESGIYFVRIENEGIQKLIIE